MIKLRLLTLLLLLALPAAVQAQYTWAFLQAIQRFDDRDDFQLQRLIQQPQLREFHLIAEIQRRPALPQDVAVRIFRDLPQRLDVARVLRPVDGGGQLVILKTEV